MVNARPGNEITIESANEKEAKKLFHKLKYEQKKLTRKKTKPC